MMYKVIWLELESQTVNELFKEIFEGIIKGNMETPAVNMTAVTKKELKIKALPGLFNSDKTIKINPEKKADAGIINKSGKWP